MSRKRARVGDSRPAMRGAHGCVGASGMRRRQSRTAFEAGLMQQSGHASADVARRYVQAGKLLDNPASKAVRL